MNDRIDAFSKMLARGQDSAMLRFSLGNEYYGQGDVTEAIPHLRTALVLDRNYSAAWKLLGKALTDTGDAAEAIRIYDEGIRIATTNGDRQAAKEMAVFLKRLQRQMELL
ncbi:MAG: tetratricopeptide repeat protein [Woeseia sp.]